MQLAEQEIILPLKKAPLLAPMLIISVLNLIILPLNLWNTFTTLMREGVSGLTITLIAAVAASFVAYGWYVIFFARKLRAPTPTLRVSHEGIFFSALIPWDEITVIYPHLTTLDEAKLRIAVRDYDAYCARYLEENRSSIVARSVLRVIFWLSRHTGQQTYVDIPGYLLPLSVYELIPEIRARFAAELQEYDISIREWER